MAANQDPLSLGFSRQEYWSGLPFPSPMHACMLSRFSRVLLCMTPWTAAHQAPLSTGFSRQEYWSGLLPFPSPLSFLAANINIIRPRSYRRKFPSKVGRLKDRQPILSSGEDVTSISFIKWKWKLKLSVTSDPFWPRGLYSPWNSPGQNTGVS